MLPRSYLFVPGDRPRMLEKAVSRGADAVIVDLEDSIAVQNKSQARAGTAEWLGNRTADSNGCERWVRFNAGTQFERDVEALAGESCDGAVLSKVTEAREVAVAVRILSAAGICRRVIPLIETARGLQASSAIAGVEGVHRMMLGEADLGAELGLFQKVPAWDSIRVRIVIASAAANLHPPIGPVDPDFSDIATFSSETKRLRRIGFSSRAAIHPAQVEAIHVAVAPSRDEIVRATRLLTAYDAAQVESVGAFVGPDGGMVDDAYARWARRIVRDAERDAAGSSQ